MIAPPTQTHSAAEPPRPDPAQPVAHPTVVLDPISPTASDDPTLAQPVVPEPAASTQDNRGVSWPSPPPHPTPRWARWALLGLLAGTALLYLWNLSINGWANSYYSAAAQAGGASWKAWFFGSLDAANSITVDKPPGSLWVMGLSVRIFGLTSWSVLVPQALIGVASVGMLYATVRRWFGAPAGLIAGAVLALTPVATLMFRFNNPDALLVLLLVLAAWAMGHAVEKASMRWIMLAGAFVGFAFLTKMMQAFLVLPGFVAMYAIAAPIDLKRRLGHLLAAFAAMVVAGGWWVAIVELWPADSRPYIGGSQTNSVLELIFGYNGFGRLTGNEVGSVGGGQAGRWGETGVGRLFSAGYGGQIAWLLPAALVMIGVLLWVSRRGGRTDLTRAATIGWGGWLLVTAAVISFGAGIIHEYYTVALAPAIGALLGIGSLALWVHRGALWTRITAAVVVAGSAAWAATLLDRSEQFLPWLGPAVLVAGLAVAALMLVGPMVPARWRHRAALGAGLAGLVVLLAGPTAYSLETAASQNSGSLPSAGPTVLGSRFAGGPGGQGRGPGGQGGPQGNGQGNRQGTPPQGGFPQGGPQGGGGGIPPNGDGNGNGSGQGSGQLPWVPGRGQGGGTGNGGTGSLLQGSEPTQQITDALLADADSYTWVAATVGANSASGYQLSTQEPVMAIGGFNGTDPSPTLAQFQQYVAEGKIHWFIAAGRGGLGGGRQNGGSQEAAQIAAWVESTFNPTTIDGVTMYDLGSASASSGTGGAVQA